MDRRPPVGMTPEEAEVDWLWALQPLLGRFGGRCEARTVDCLAGPVSRRRVQVKILGLLPCDLTVAGV